MKRMSNVIVATLLLICTLTSTIAFVNAQALDHHESWDKEITDMLDYIGATWNPATNDFDWLYPNDGEKYQLFLQTGQSVELIRERNKDTSVLGIIDASFARKTVLDLINIWKMDYYVNTQSMFSVLSFLKMTTDSEVTSMVGAFQDHLDVAYVDIDGRTFASVKEIKSFVEARSYSNTFEVNWGEASKVMEIKIGGGQVSWFTIGISIWDCLDAFFNHNTIAEEIAALPLPSVSDTDRNIVQKVKEHEGIQVELGRLTTDLAEVVGKFIGSQIGKSIGLNIGAAMGASFMAAFPPAPVVGAAIGYFAGGVLVGELVGQAARVAAGILTNELVGKPLVQYIQELGIPTISAEISQIYSQGGDNDVSTKEKIYVKVKNNDAAGSPEREIIISVNPSFWEITDYWGTLEWERLDFDNTKTVKLKPGESETVWFAAIPDGIHINEELTFVLWHRTGMLWWTKDALVDTHHEVFHSEFAFVQIDLVLVLDRSGSMSGAKIGAAKDSAIAVVNSLMSVDRAAVVSFASSGNVNSHLANDFEYVKAQIQKISAGGMTSFGAGLNLGLNEFKTSGNTDHAWIMIFLSDGKHNTPPAPNPYVAECKNLGIPIYTIGIGDVSENVLKWMASETGGKYLYAPSLYELQNIFLRFSLEGTGWTPEAEFSGTVYEDQTVVAGTFNIAPFTAFARVTLNWPGSDLDLILIRPDGRKVDFFWDLDVVYSGSSSKPEWVILLAPAEGVWTVKVYGKAINSPDEPFVVWISSYTPPIPDTDPPTTSLTIGPLKYIGSLGQIYILPSTMLTLDSTDGNGTGVAQTSYRVYNTTYTTEWILGLPPVSFQVTGLVDGAYCIDYNSTDMRGNVENSSTICITIFSWDYSFEDSFGRNTKLDANVEHEFFRFTTLNKDYGIRRATYMQAYSRSMIIRHCDSELRLVTVAVDMRLDFCMAVAWDMQVGARYLLVDRLRTKGSGGIASTRLL